MHNYLFAIEVICLLGLLAIYIFLLKISCSSVYFRDFIDEKICASFL